LPERFHEHGAARSGARIQETDAEDFSWLLRLDCTARSKEQGA
jgi:hypothetical protein